MNIGAPSHHHQPAAAALGPTTLGSRNPSRQNIDSLAADLTPLAASTRPTLDHSGATQPTSDLPRTLIVVTGDSKGNQISSPSPTSTASLTAAATSSIIHDSSRSSPVADQQQYRTFKKNLKTEYKSNFTPFDQYVYNENTDSFVKHQHCKLAPAHSGNQLNLSGSSQDLNSLDARGAVDPSPVLNVEAFGPLSNGNPADHSSEPWYKEVVRRNEKAHEYRYKSEVGHSSPLSKLVVADEDPLVRRSPCGNDPLIEAQIRDRQEEILRGQTSGSATSASAKPAFKFSPNDYSKRDHMISHMANNNNFNLPKQADPIGPSTTTGSTTSTAAARQRAAASAHSRPTTRSAAQSRARSQSSRRPLATTGGAPVSSKAQPESKSNQTTPTKKLSSTTGRSPATTATTRSAIGGATRRPTTGVSASATGAPSSRTATSGAARQRPPSAITKTTPRLANGTVESARPVASTTRPSPSAGVAPKARLSSRASPASGTASSPVKRPTTAALGSTRTPLTSAAKAPRPPVGRSSATSSVGASRPKVSPPTSKSSSGAPTPTSSQVKSIKTPKALASAQEKAAAAALAAGSAATVAAIASGAKAEVEPEPSDQLFANDTQQLANISDGNETLTTTSQNLAGELSRFDEFAGSAAGRQSEAVNNFLHEQTFGTPDTNMLFTTAIGETGNMLADELAQAEKAANESANNNQSVGERLRGNSGESDQPVVGSPTPETAARVDPFAVASGDHANARESQAAMTSSTRSDDSAGELFNGLKGGLVSAEDRFSSSEKDASLDDQRGGDQQPAGGLFEVDGPQQQQGDNYDEEPYSIMPTTFDVVNKHSQLGGSDDTAKVETAASQAQQDGARAEQSKLIEDQVETTLGTDYVETVSSCNHQNSDQAATNFNDIRSDSKGDRQMLDLAEQQSEHEDKLLGDRRSPSVDSSSSSSSSRNKDELVERNDDGPTVSIGELADKNQVFERSNEADDEADKLDSSASSSTNKSWDKMYQVQSDHKEALEDDDVGSKDKLREEEALVGAGYIQTNLVEDWPRQHQQQQEQVCQNDEDETQKFRQVFDEHRLDEELNRLVDESEEKPEQAGQQPIEMNANKNDHDVKRHEFEENFDLLENRRASSDDKRLDSVELSQRTDPRQDENETREKSLDCEIVSLDQRRDVSVSEVGGAGGHSGELELANVAVDGKGDGSLTILSSATGESSDSGKIATPQEGQTQPVNLTQDYDNHSTSGHDAAVQAATPGGLQGRGEIEPTRADGQPLEQSARDNESVDSSLLVESTRQQENRNKKSVSSSGSSCDDDARPAESRASELLMNVADLVDFEARTKQELARRAELARQQSGSMASPPGGEMLLSPDQLISALGDDGLAAPAAAPAGKPEPGAAIDFSGAIGTAEHSALGGSVDIDSRAAGATATSEQRPQKPLETGLEPQVTSLSTGPTGEEDKSAGGSGDQRHSSVEQEDEIGSGEKRAIRRSSSSSSSSSGGGSSGAANQGDRLTGAFEPRTEHLSNYDELDNDEHLKMSNHLTNSDDDELIREPRSSIDLDETLLSATMASANNNNDLVQSESTTNFGLVPSDLSSPRYNEGAGLSNLIAAQDEHDDDDNGDQIRFEASGAVASEPSAGAASAASTSASATAAAGASGEGSSLAAAAAPPTAAATTTSTMPDELPPATAAAFIRAPKLAHNEADSDSDDELLDLNDANQVDRITDVAATMSPSSSVASELLRTTNKVSYSASLDNEAGPTNGSPVKLGDNNNETDLSSNELRRPSESDAKPAAEQLVLSRS